MRQLMKSAGLLIAATALLFLTACQPGSGAEAKAGAAGPVVWKFYTVQSPSTGKIERFWVGHAATLKSDGQYPVIYFLPGLQDGDDTWKDALNPHLAKAEVIAVCPAVGGASWFMNSPAQQWMKWGDFLTEDLRGFVESHYPAAKEKDQRGIAGISSGGHGAFYNALARPDLYSAVSVLSGAMELRAYVGQAGLDLWIGGREATPLYAERSCIVLAGKHEGPLPFSLFLDAGDEDGARPQMEAFKKVLDAKGVSYKWNLGKGAHSWAYWNSRAADHLAWFAAEFARNKADRKYLEKTPPKAAELKILDGPPAVALSEEAVRRLQAPWDERVDLVAVPVKGLDPKGTPLMADDPKHKAVPFTATLPAHGQAAALFVSRVKVTVVEPLTKEGTILLSGSARNGRNLSFTFLPATPLTVPAGESQRRVELRARMAVELKTPDPLRGGIVMAIQPLDAAGKPVGKPVTTELQPGTHNLELWTIAPAMLGEWTLTPGGPSPLPLAAIEGVQIQAEP